jgi:two-component system, response regulator YesN
MWYVTRFFRNKPIFIKMALSYALLGATLVSIFSILLTNRVTGEMVSEIKAHTEQSVYQSYSTADIVLKSTYDYFYQVFERDKQILDGMRARELDEAAVREINDRLEELLHTRPLVNSLVDSVYIYNFHADKVFSTSAPDMGIEEFYDTAMTELVRDVGANWSIYSLIPRRQQYFYKNEYHFSNVISILYADTAKDDIARGVMVVNLNQQVFQDLVSKGNLGSFSVSLIIDGKGNIISHPESSMINMNLEEEAYVKAIIQSSKKTGDMLEKVDGKQSLITYMKSDRFGWSFIGITEYEKLIDKARTLKRFIYLLTLFLIVLGIITGGFFTNVFYKPIRRLLDKIRRLGEHPAEGQAGGEYELLSKSFDNMHNRISDLQADLQSQLPDSKKSLLSELLQGDVRYRGDLMQKLESTGIQLRQGPLQAGVVRIDRYSHLMKYYGIRDMSLLKYSAMNIAEEVMKLHSNVELLEDAEDSFTLIWNLDEAAMNLEPIMNEIKYLISQYSKLSVTIGLGVAAESFERLHHSWNSALQATRYRLVYGTGQVICYNRIQHDQENRYEYPLHLEKWIIDHLKMGHLSKLSEAFDSFLDYIRVFRFDEIVLALNQLMVMTLRVSMDMVDDDSYEWMLELQDVHNQLRMHDTLDEIGVWYVGLCKQIVKIRNEKAAGKSRERVKAMLRFIQEQYGNPNFSVDQLAEHVGFSTNYARKVFKDFIGQSISVYLNEYRLGKAKELLLQTDLPASRIGEAVGIENASYFSASFKKYTGKTPDHFRKAERLTTK